MPILPQTSQVDQPNFANNRSRPFCSDHFLKKGGILAKGSNRSLGDFSSGEAMVIFLYYLDSGVVSRKATHAVTYLKGAVSAFQFSDVGLQERVHRRRKLR